MGLKIIMAVCFLPCMFIMFGALYVEGKQKGNVLLGATLWPGAGQEEDVIKISRRYKKEMRWILLISTLLFLCTCIPKRGSIVLSTQMLWLIYILVIFFVPLARGNQRLKALKRERVGEQPEHKVYVDMKAAAAPKEKPFLKCSVAGALCGLFPVAGELFLAAEAFYGWWTELLLAVMFLTGLTILWVQYRYWHMRTDVISYRSEVNIQLARVNQYQWSRFWCAMIWGNTLCTLCLWYGMHHPDATFYVVMAVVMLYTGIAAVMIAVTQHNVRKAYSAFTEEAGLSVEEDEHWIYGIFYYNKNDKRFLVNKRAGGIGTTVNLAKPSGKIFCIVILVGTLALLVWAGVLVLLEDFVPVSLKMADQAVISSQYHEEYRIPFEEIESVELVEELPSMSKRVGTSMDTIKKGSFMTEGYVSCKVCVRIKEPPFVKITDEDGMIYYFNDEEPEVTLTVYRELLEAAGMDTK